jgi:hypothetical protein
VRYLAFVVQDASEDLQQLSKNIVLTFVLVGVHRASESLGRAEMLDHHAHRRLHHARVVWAWLGEQVHKRLKLTAEWQSLVLTGWLTVKLVEVLASHAALVQDAAVQLGRNFVVTSVDGPQHMNVRVEVLVQILLFAVRLAVHTHRMRLVHSCLFGHQFLPTRFARTGRDRPLARRVEAVDARRQRLHLEPIENRGDHSLDKSRDGDSRGLKIDSTQWCWLGQGEQVC